MPIAIRAGTPTGCMSQTATRAQPPRSHSRAWRMKSPSSESITAGMKAMTRSTSVATRKIAPARSASPAQPPSRLDSRLGPSVGRPGGSVWMYMLRGVAAAFP